MIDRFSLHESQSRRTASGVLAGSLGVLMIAGCGSSSHDKELVFDDLGSNSSIIQVYPGPGDRPGDKELNGTYKDGQKVEAICKTLGRTVISQPPEIHRQSNEWIRFKDTNDNVHYATAVYIEDPKDLLKNLEEC